MKQISRRKILRAGSAAILVGGGIPLIGARSAFSSPRFVGRIGQSDEMAPFADANIDWRQAEGQEITVLITPAHYFAKFQAITDQFFNELTGINVKFEVLPPKELREKAVLDLASGSGNYATHTADPMYLPLFAARDWVEPLNTYLDDDTLTDAEWFDVGDIVPNWTAANTVDDKLMGMPVEGEVTIHIYRADVMEDLGVDPPDTLDDFKAVAEQAHSDTMAGAALRGFLGAGQNMYIYPSLFLEFGGAWFGDDGSPIVNSDAGVAALDYYVSLLQTTGPQGVENWNWPEIMEAFANEGVAQYIDANSTASVLESPAKSKVAGKVGYKRWPTGPEGRRVSSIWNWAMPINKSLDDDQKKATWLYLQWLSSRAFQLLSASYMETEDAVVRTGVNRTSIWEDDSYRDLIGFTDDYVDVVLSALTEDTDPDWRPRVPQWPEIGDIMAIAVQSALTNQGTPQEVLDDANGQISELMG